MAATQQQSESGEFERLWSALDKTNQYIEELEQRFEKRLPRLPPVVTPLAAKCGVCLACEDGVECLQPRQQGPSPDYRIREVAREAVDKAWERHGHKIRATPDDGPCGCDESESLRKRLEQQRSDFDAAAQRHDALRKELVTARDAAEAGLEVADAECDAQRLRAKNAENQVENLQTSLNDAELRIRELEAALAESQSRASTAPASQADILCVEERLRGFEIKLGVHGAKLAELDQRTIGSATTHSLTGCYGVGG